MDHLIKSLSRTNFTSLLPLLIAVVTFLYSLTIKTIPNRLKWIKIYLFSYAISIIFFDLVELYMGYYSPPLSAIYELELGSDLLFTILEFFLFIIYFVHLKDLFPKNHLIIISILFLIITITILLIDFHHYSSLYYKTVQKIFTLQAALLVFPCFYYYKKLFTNTPRLKLSQDPDFWIMTG